MHPTLDLEQNSTVFSCVFNGIRVQRQSIANFFLLVACQPFQLFFYHDHLCKVWLHLTLWCWTSSMPLIELENCQFPNRNLGFSLWSTFLFSLSQMACLFTTHVLPLVSCQSDWQDTSKTRAGHEPRAGQEPLVYCFHWNGTQIEKWRGPTGWSTEVVRWY